MRIAYIGGSYVPSREANSMHQMRMAHAFARLGHNVTLHVRPGKPVVPDDHAHYGVAPNFEIVKHARPQIRVYGAIVNALRVDQWFRGHPLPDLVYGRETYAISLIARTGVPFIYESHWKPKTVAHRALETTLFQRPNFRGVVLISEALRSIYEEAFPSLAPDRILVAHDAADPVPDLPDAHGSQRLQVAYVGGFLPGYGIDVVVQLARVMPDVAFHVVGGKELELQAWRERTRAIENLTLHGFVAPAQLARLYARFDVMLAPYQPDTAHIRWISPMKLFEYMAHDKAIVCSDFPVMREILENEVDALLVPPTDVDAWRRAIERLRGSGQRRALSTRARAKLESHFTWERRAERVLMLAGESARGVIPGEEQCATTATRRRHGLSGH